MQGPFSTRRGAAIYLLLWFFLSLVLAGVVVSASGAAWTNSVLLVVPVTLVYAFAAGFSAYYVCRAYPLTEKSPVAIAVVFLVAAMISGGLWNAVGLAWNALLLSTGAEWAGLDVTRSMKVAMFALGILLYCLCAAAHYLAIEFERTKLAERRVLESKLAAQEAELRMLRTQIDPHFLFNSLNSISALTSQNPVGAREMTLQLADFFRQSLGMEAHKTVTLEAELTLIRHFLAIEKIRFGERLRSEQQIDDAACACLLPPMILQPLVENAIKHGIGNLTEGGTVRVTAARAGSILRIGVENDVDDDMPAAKGNGIGLLNVRHRLGAMYGHQASINWARQGNLFRVEISLPATTTEQACAS